MRKRNSAVLRCTLCKTGLMGQDSYDSHVNGRRHKQRLSQRSFSARNAAITEKERELERRRRRQREESPRRSFGSSTMTLPRWLMTPVSPSSESTLRRDPYVHAMQWTSLSRDSLGNEEPYEEPYEEPKAAGDAGANGIDGASCGDVSEVGQAASPRGIRTAFTLPPSVVPVADSLTERWPSGMRGDSCSPSRRPDSSAVHALDSPEVLDTVSIYSDDDDVNMINAVGSNREVVLVVSDDETISAVGHEAVRAEHVPNPTSAMSSRPAAQVIDLCDDPESAFSTDATGRECPASSSTFDRRTRRLL